MPANYADVERAVRKLADGYEHGIEAPGITQSIASELGTSVRYTDQFSRLTAQIRRALNKMTDEGLLVKESDGNSAAFYTLEYQTKRLAARKAREAETEAARQRLREVRSHLAALGLAGGVTAMTSYNGGSVTLSLDAMEKLVGLARGEGR